VEKREHLYRRKSRMVVGKTNGLVEKWSLYGSRGRGDDYYFLSVSQTINSSVNSTEMGVSKMVESSVKTELRREIKQLDNGLKASFTRVKEEFDDHLCAINENTEELGLLHGRLSEFDSKMEKLNTRIDNIHMMFRQILVANTISVDLTNEEQKIFVMLCNYTKYICQDDVVIKTFMSSEDIEECITAMKDKGIVIDRRELEGKVYYRLDPEFKEEQQKTGMIKINSAVTQQFENKMLNTFFV